MEIEKLKDDIDGYGYYVKQSMPEVWRIVCAKYQAEFEEIKEHNLSLKEGETKTECWFSGDRFYKGGDIIEEKILPPPPKR